MNEFFVNLQVKPNIATLGAAVHRGGIETYFFETHAFIHLYEYRAKMWINGELYEIEAGNLGFAPAGHQLKYEFIQDKNPHIFIRLNVPLEMANYMRATMLQLGEHFSRVKSRLIEVLVCHSINPLQAEIKLWDLLWEIRDVLKQKNTSGRHVHEAKSWIELNLNIEDPMDGLIKKLKVSYRHLNHLFKKEEGISLGTYIRNRRMSHAIALLQSTSLRVKDVAAQCGYVDLQQFNKLIKKYSGLSPTGYRNMEEIM